MKILIRLMYLLLLINFDSYSMKRKISDEINKTNTKSLKLNYAEQELIDNEHIELNQNISQFQNDHVIDSNVRNCFGNIYSEHKINALVSEAKFKVLDNNLLRLPIEIRYLLWLRTFESIIDSTLNQWMEEYNSTKQPIKSWYKYSADFNIYKLYAAFLGDPDHHSIPVSADCSLYNDGLGNDVKFKQHISNYLQSSLIKKLKTLNRSRLSSFVKNFMNEFFTSPQVRLNDSEEKCLPNTEYLQGSYKKIVIYFMKILTIIGIEPGTFFQYSNRPPRDSNLIQIALILGNVVLMELLNINHLDDLVEACACAEDIYEEQLAIKCLQLLSCIAESTDNSEEEQLKFVQFLMKITDNVFVSRDNTPNNILNAQFKFLSKLIEKDKIALLKNLFPSKIKHYKEPNSFFRSGDNLLNIAILYDKPQSLAYLLNHIDVNCYHDITPLVCAVTNNNPKAVELLLNAPNMHSGDVGTSLTIPGELAYEKFQRLKNNSSILMLKLFAEKNIPLPLTVLDLIHINFPALIGAMVTQGHDINQISRYCGCFGLMNYTPLALAIKFGFIDCIKELVKYNANIHSPFLFQHVCEIEEEELGLETAKYLISQGVNYREENNRGYNYLHLAASYNKVLILKYLIELGLDVNKPDSSGKTPFMHAVKNEADEVIAFLETYNSKQE